MSEENDLITTAEAGDKKEIIPNTESLGMIISALEYLREEARRTSVKEVETVIDSAFKTCVKISCVGNHTKNIKNREI